MIKIKKETNTKITGKGILKKVTDNGIEIQDMKTGEVDTITFELLNELVGLEISISMASKVEINEE